MWRGLLFVVFMVGACKAQLIGATSSSSGSSPTTASSPMVSSSPTRADDRASGASTAEIITLPDTMGMTRSQAEAALRAAGVGGNIHVNENGSSNPATAKVCGQSPGGGRQSRTSLGVTISLCAEKYRFVENRTELVGFSVEEATKRARAAGFTKEIDVRTCTGCACKLDTVCSVSPDRWELNQDRLILFVARAATITLPD